ncbi:MFS transporter [Sphingobium baderi]|uniref:MFS transporter n=1 Tax=Sphingobium baderi TaxID=1332080 RepID=UPI0013766A69|nr:MFS transporter [Sphingobium baderi]
MVAELAAGLETTLMFAALPTALKVVGRPAEVGWLITGYLLVSAAAAAICGRLGDLFGRRRVLLITLGLATAGSFVSALSPDVHWIVAGRAVQGLAGAVLPLCYGLLQETLPPAKVPLGIGIISAANSFSAAAGFIIGGIIVDSTHWQSIFICSALLALAGFITCLAYIPKSLQRHAAGRLDVLGGILFAPAVAMLLWAVTMFQQRGAASATPWGWLGASILLLALWFFHERRHPQPTVDVRLLGNRRILASNMAAICASLGALQVLQVFPILLQQPIWTGVGFGLTATLTGLLKLPSNLTSVIGASWGGALCARWDGRTIMIGAAISSLGAWALMWVNHHSLWLTVVLVCFSSAGFTTLFTSVINIVVATAPEDRTSEAAAMTATFRTVAQSIGSQIITLLFAAELVKQATGPAYPAPAAHEAVMVYMVLASAGALAAALWVPPRRGPFNGIRGEVLA